MQWIQLYIYIFTLSLWNQGGTSSEVNTHWGRDRDYLLQLQSGAPSCFCFFSSSFFLPLLLPLFEKNSEPPPAHRTTIQRRKLQPINNRFFQNKVARPPPHNTQHPSFESASIPSRWSCSFYMCCFGLMWTILKDNEGILSTNSCLLSMFLQQLSRSCCVSPVIFCRHCLVVPGWTLWLVYLWGTTAHSLFSFTILTFPCSCLLQWAGIRRATKLIILRAFTTCLA